MTPVCEPTWSDILAAFAWHEQPGEACVAGNARWFCSLAGIDDLPEIISAETMTVSAEVWGHDRLRALQRYMEAIGSPYMDPESPPRDAHRPIIVLRIAGRVGLLDGAHRIQQWLTEDDTGRPVLAIESRTMIRPTRVNILCPGPSLKETWHGGFVGFDSYGEVIAVNRAALPQHATVARDYWWCVGDYEECFRCMPDFHYVWEYVKGIATLHRVECPREAYGHSNVVYFQEFDLSRSRHRLPDQACSFSATAALVLAFSLGADEIHCYGADMVGSQYCDGADVAGDIEDRWQRERTIWDNVTRWLNKHGVPVIRHRPAVEAAA